MKKTWWSAVGLNLSLPLIYIFQDFAFHRHKFKRAVKICTVIACLRNKVGFMLYAYDVIDGPLASKLNYQWKILCHLFLNVTWMQKYFSVRIHGEDILALPWTLPFLKEVQNYCFFPSSGKYRSPLLKMNSLQLPSMKPLLNPKVLLFFPRSQASALVIVSVSREPV